MAGEIDLEIGLRQRLVKTLQSRIAWAGTLQESLGKAKGRNSDEIDSFRRAALEAVLAIEAPSECIYSREISAPLQFNRITRPPPKQKPFLTRNPSARFLYISSAALGSARMGGGPPVQFYLLKCPTCSRTAFTSLQGLLNHARISHSLEWGTHDECVRACAVNDPNIDIDAGIEVGLGPVGVTPGIRTIFEMAVGTHSHEFERSNGDGFDMKGIRETSPGSLLTQTLGLHKDTPALAPFLGKRAHRKEITVCNEDDPVDILGTDEPNDSMKKTWKMMYAQRSFAAPSMLQEEINTSVSEVYSLPFSSFDKEDGSGIGPDMSKTPLRSQGSPLNPIINLPTAASRFHFLARVVVADRSLYIDPSVRYAHPQNHTHKWMISVDAPAYSYHITSILQRMTVFPHAEPSSAVALTRSTTTEPPFVIVGTCDRPFLARVEFLFTPIHNSSDEGQKFTVEHWIELDLLRSSVAVLGEEQVLDVELDKQTTLKPAKTGYTPVESKTLWDNTNVAPTPQETPQCEAKPEVQDTQVYEQILSELVKSFPMTLKDAKGTQSSIESLPYMIVSSPSHFKELIVGRRKAIEWGRAKAIADAYASAIIDLDPDKAQLSTADVYLWLHKMGHFPSVLLIKQPMNEVKEETTDDHIPAEPVEQWCRFCGLSLNLHLANSIKQESEIAATPGMPWTSNDPTHPCSVVSTELRTFIFPMINIHHMLTAGPNDRVQVFNRSASNCEPQVCLDPHQLVLTSEPQLTLSICKLVELLGLSTFSTSPSLSPPRRSIGFHSPLRELGESMSQVEARLAPYALLSHLTRRFVRELVESALEVANRDKMVASGVVTPTMHKAEKRRSKKTHDTSTRLLTPTHILNGVLAPEKERNPRQEKVNMAVFLCLARLGMIHQPALDPVVAQNVRVISSEE